MVFILRAYATNTSSRTVSMKESYFDTVEISDSFDCISFNEGVRASDLSVNSQKFGNASISGHDVVLGSNIELQRTTGKVRQSSSSIVMKPTIWTLLTELIRVDALLYTNGGVCCEINKLRCARMSDWIYMAEECVVHPIIEMRQMLGSGILRTVIGCSDEIQLLKRYNVVKHEDGVYSINPDDCGYIGMERGIFGCIISPDLIAYQQYLIEQYKIIYLAIWFADTISNFMSGDDTSVLGPINNDMEPAGDNTPIFIYDVEAIRVTDIQLKSNLYGMTRDLWIVETKRFFRERSNGGYDRYRKFIVNVFGSSSLNDLFVDKFISCIQKTANDRSRDFLEIEMKHALSCIALENIHFYMLKSMMMEYDYYRESFKRGIMYKDLCLKILKCVD